jgi:hypothetical protein
MEVSWTSTGGFSPFPFDAVPKRTVFTFSDNDLITEINTIFDNNRAFTDFFEYNQQKRVSKIRREDQSQGIEYLATFYYRSGSVDSIALEMSVEKNNISSKYTGFFKKATVDTYVSIFPFDKALPYTLMDGYLQNNSQTSFQTANNNDIYKWGHTIVLREDDWYEVEVITKVRSQREVYTDQFETRTTGGDGYSSSYFYDEETTYVSGQGVAYSDGQYSNLGLGYAYLFADHFPDAYLLNQVFYLIDFTEKTEPGNSINYQITPSYAWTK